MKKVGLNFILALGLVGCGSNHEVKQIHVDSIVDFPKKNMETASTFVATAIDYQTNSIAPNSVMMGYLIDGYKPTKAQFKEMTHVAISFLRAVNSYGDVKMTPGWENLNEVVEAAHANNVKAIISFGGGDFKVTAELMGVKANRKNLIKNIIAFIREYKFDGFDCDWEPSWMDDKIEMETVNNSITDHYIKFIKEFREALDNEFGKGSKVFTAAILNGNSIRYSAIKQIAHFPQNGWWNYLDWIALMNYDNDLGVKHATFESVFGPKGSIAYWTKFGIPKEKIVIGVPFYARGGWGPEWLFYKDVIKMNPLIADTIDHILYSKDNVGKKEYGFNGTAILIKKVEESKRLNLSGIMFWQLAGDLPVDHEKSLLRVMSKEFKK